MKNGNSLIVPAIPEICPSIPLDGNQKSYRSHGLHSICTVEEMFPKTAMNPIPSSAQYHLFASAIPRLSAIVIVLANVRIIVRL